MIEGQVQKTRLKYRKKLIGDFKMIDSIQKSKKVLIQFIRTK